MLTSMNCFILSTFMHDEKAKPSNKMKIQKNNSRLSDSKSLIIVIVTYSLGLQFWIAPSVVVWQGKENRMDNHSNLISEIENWKYFSHRMFRVQICPVSSYRR